MVASDAALFLTAEERESFVGGRISVLFSFLIRFS